jgi:hypothetical protein
MENKKMVEIDEQMPAPKQLPANLHLRTAIRAGEALEDDDEEPEWLYGEDLDSDE